MDLNRIANATEHRLIKSMLAEHGYADKDVIDIPFNRTALCGDSSGRKHQAAEDVMEWAPTQVRERKKGMNAPESLAFRTPGGSTQRIRMVHETRRFEWRSVTDFVGSSSLMVMDS